MSLNALLTPNVTVNGLFDLTGVQFAGEDEAVLFAASSGDVLRCAAKDWGQFLLQPTDPPAALQTALSNLGLRLK